MQAMRPSKCLCCLAAVLFLTLAGRAEAACETRHRVLPQDSQCMRANWTSEKYWAANDCSHTIRVKVDVARVSDVTFELNGGTGIGWTGANLGWNGYIRNVTCCSDYSSCD